MTIASQLLQVIFDRDIQVKCAEIAEFYHYNGQVSMSELVEKHGEPQMRLQPSQYWKWKLAIVAHNFLM